MAERHVGALLVMKGTELQGIVSERDYARKVILHGRSSAETPVWQIMSSPVTTVTTDQTLQDCMQLDDPASYPSSAGRGRKRWWAMISIGDLVKR